MENHEPENPAPPPFRWNVRVVQVVVLVMVALALPLTLAILGFRDMRKPVVPSTEEPAPEMEGLRGALESTVDARWTAPVLDSGARRAVKEVANGEECLRLGNAVQEVAKKMDLTVVIPEKIESGGTRWLVQMPTGSVSTFELELGMLGFTGLGGGTPSGTGVVLYEVEIPFRP
ncbi:MAG: hypothetical protein ACKOAS_04660 [Verrucomicrobiota bacterium]